jgi:hypothetical protein
VSALRTNRAGHIKRSLHDEAQLNKAHPTLGKYFKRGRMNGFAMVWRMAKIGRLIVTIAFSIAILLSNIGLPVIANGSQNSAQSNPVGT